MGKQTCMCAIMPDEAAETMAKATNKYAVKPPNEFVFRNPQTWPKWVGRFEIFRVSSGFHEEDDAT